MKILPQSAMPLEISQKLREIGAMWAASVTRPRLDADTKAYWDDLVSAWANSDLPLVIRKGGVRGAPVSHPSGRRIVLADNSPAQWAFSRAFAGARYSIDDICEFFKRDEVPYAMVLTKEARRQAEFKCKLGAPDNVNIKGWKLCHFDDVGLNTRTALEQVSLNTLIRHFCFLLRPSNHFLVPLAWAGLGELPEIIDETRRFEANEDNAFAPLSKTGPA